MFIFCGLRCDSAFGELSAELHDLQGLQMVQPNDLRVLSYDTFTGGSPSGSQEWFVEKWNLFEGPYILYLA